MDFRKALGVPHTLKEFGVDESKFDLVAKMAPDDPTAGGNPVPLTEAAARALLDKAYRGEVK